MKGRLFTFGVETDPAFLSVDEQAATDAVGRWYSLRGEFGAIWVARRGSDVVVKSHINNDKRWAVPPLLAILGRLRGLP